MEKSIFWHINGEQILILISDRFKFMAKKSLKEIEKFDSGSKCVINNY